MQYKYRAYKNNKVVTGTIEADTLSDALTYLKHNGLFTIEVRKISGDSLAFLKVFFNQVSFNDVVDLTRQLSIMLNAGLTLIDAFEILKKQLTKGPVLDLIDNIDKEIRSGESFSNALKRYPHLFSNVYIALVKAGEASGKLNEVLARLAENLEKQREFKGKIKGAMIYPAIVFVGMLIVVFVMITFVIPKLLDLYKDLDVTLPITTQILIMVSSFSSRFWPFIIITVVVGVILLKNYLKTKPGKLMRDSLLLRAPFFKNVVKTSALVDSVRTLSVLIGSGVPILDGLNIMIETSDNVIFQQAFKNVYIQVEKGISMGQAMSNEKIFPPILVQMATVGEQTGHLDSTLFKIANYFEMESEFAVKALTSLIEPAIIVVLGVGVGFLIFSVITPIYTLTNKF